MNTWKPIAAALVIFAAGVVTGGLTVNLRRASAFPTSQHSQPQPEKPERPDAPNAGRPAHPLAAETQLRDLSTRMSRSLDLTKEQRDRVQAILKDTQGRMRAIADEFAPRTREELRTMRDRIREELTPEQRRKFEELYRNRETRNRRPQPPAE